MWHKVILALALFPTVALAQTLGRPTCSAYVGTVVQPGTFAAAVAQLSKVPKLKGEFETEAQFQQRQALALPALDKPLILSKALDPKFLTYDADSGLLRIGLYAFDNLNTDYYKVFGYGTPFDRKVDYDLHDNIDVVISEREVTTGSYIGTNAFGVRARVAKVNRITNAIFDRAAKPGQDQLFPAEGPDWIVATLKQTPAEAQLLKPKLKGAFVAYPKWPYVASGVQDWGEPTIDNPEEVTQHITVIVADIACGLLLDAENKVLAAFGRR